MPQIKVDSLDVERYNVPAVNYEVNRDAGECVIWYEPDDNDVIKPSHVTWVEDKKIDGLEFKVQVSSNGWLISWGKGQNHQSAIAESDWHLKCILMEESHVKVDRTAEFDAGLWDECKEDLRNIQLKLNVADKCINGEDA